MNLFFLNYAYIFLILNINYGLFQGIGSVSEHLSDHLSDISSFSRPLIIGHLIDSFILFLHLFVGVIIILRGKSCVVVVSSFVWVVIRSHHCICDSTIWLWMLHHEQIVLTVIKVNFYTFYRTFIIEIPQASFNFVRSDLWILSFSI